ncbi:MAG: DISARM system helicase DrmA [Acidobacteriota bacterium]
MTAADVRRRLTGAVRLDLIGPAPEAGADAEVLDRAPTRWYLSGFLAPWNAPSAQKEDEEGQEELDGLAPGDGPGDDDQETREGQAARRGRFPSSMGLSVLVPETATTLSVTAQWGDYEPATDRAGAYTGRWQRRQRQQAVTVALNRDRAEVDLAESGGLQVVATVRQIRRPTDLRGLPKDTRAVSVFLVNRRAPIEGQGDLKDKAFVFQAGLVVECDQPFVPRPNPRGGATDDEDERIADLQFRDAREYAVGHGVATRSVISDGACRRVETTWIPEYEVERVEPARIDDVTLGMQALADLPGAAAARQALMPLAERYRAWIGDQRRAAPKDGEQGEVSAMLLESAERAAGRIEAGIALLEQPVAFDAFRLANRAMAMAARQRRAQERGITPDQVEPPEWRPFQLAFLLMNLRAFAEPTHDDREIVDLLFFPTGGGKTEAYLGLAAFAILIRRLRNPDLTSAGVTVLMRYTLRLLTLDQLSRAATLVCALELMRQEPGMADRLGTWPFEIGLWVGKAATPNRMGRHGDNDRTSALAKTRAYKNNSKKPIPIPIEVCPWCGSRLVPDSFTLYPDSITPTDLRVVCVARGCAFRGNRALPIVAVDDPLYRRVPCFVIATVDKFASLPWVGASGALLGGADRHDKAGFYGPWQPGVGQKLSRPLAPPDLIIQDELHLISGPLGTMAGLYEAAVDHLCTRGEGRERIRPKVVASTATVRKATDQIRALFGRAQVEVFPPPGPDRRDSFFAKTMDLATSPGRLYLGVAAQGRSLKVVLLRTYLALLAAAEKAWVEAGGAKNPDNPADPYMTLLGYFNSLRELGGSRRIVEDEVASRVGGYGERKRVNEKEGSFASRKMSREVCELTSRASTANVSETKRRLAVSFSDTKDRVDVALATNMISVGLDITRLGLMVVLGQPKATAEYIQATSRVGRDRNKPGLVVTLLNVHRPRDRSHYERFEAFHQTFYRSVEATSVTPFAAPVLDRALPAVVVALARHLRPALTPPKGAVNMAAERAGVDAVAAALVARATAHRSLSADEEKRLVAQVRGRVNDLLDSWAKIARAKQDTGARLVYQKHEDADGPPLLRMPLDPELDTLNQDERKFKAPRSLRDVEPSVNLIVKRLDGTEIELPAVEEDA